MAIKIGKLLGGFLGYYREIIGLGLCAKNKLKIKWSNNKHLVSWPNLVSFTKWLGGQSVRGPTLHCAILYGMVNLEKLFYVRKFYKSCTQMQYACRISTIFRSRILWAWRNKTIIFTTTNKMNKLFHRIKNCKKQISTAQTKDGS